MFTVEHYYVKEAGGLQKVAGALEDTQGIMDKIYAEDPSFWPYGLTTDPGKGGEVYLVRDSLTKQAAGFVGWQTFMEKGARIGSYYIGILPEYRGRGLAKQAVAKVLQKNASTVDILRAYVMPHNKPSQALAASLHIPVMSPA